MHFQTEISFKGKNVFLFKMAKNYYFQVFGMKKDCQQINCAFSLIIFTDSSKQQKQHTKLLTNFKLVSISHLHILFPFDLPREHSPIFYYARSFKQQLHISMYKRYKERYTFEERVNKVKAFKESDSDKVMIIVEKHPKSKLPDLINSKFLTFKKFKFLQVKNLIEKKIKEKLGSEREGKQSYFLFVSGKTPLNDQTMQSIYERCKDQDGILYVTYQQQQSF